MDITNILLILSASTISFLLGWYFSKSKVVDSYSNRIADFERNNTILQRDFQNSERNILDIKNSCSKLENEKNKLINEKNELAKELSSTNVRYEELQNKLNDQEKNLEKLQNKFTADFKIVANSILEKNTTDFSKAHQEKLGEILSPLKDKIISFEESIEKKYIDETKERSGLKQEIKQLMEMNQSLNIEAQNLTKALKGNNKKQGNWGEIILENLLENSGLTKGSEYELQFNILNSSQQRSIPDAIIRLPGNKHIVIDSKVSLIAYERFCNEEEENIQFHLRDHISSIKGHINNLSSKNYHHSKNLNSPDFVLMFIPIESSFSVAIKTDRELFSYAWNKNVVLTSPSTLLATLRTIASVWKYEKQTKNAVKIASEAGKMYDKFRNFVDDMHQIDKNIKLSHQSFENAFNKLSTGRGNLISKAEKLRQLGIKTSKNISADFPDLAQENGSISITEPPANEEA